MLEIIFTSSINPVVIVVVVVAICYYYCSVLFSVMQYPVLDPGMEKKNHEQRYQVLTLHIIVPPQIILLWLLSVLEVRYRVQAMLEGTHLIVSPSVGWLCFYPKKNWPILLLGLHCLMVMPVRALSTLPDVYLHVCFLYYSELFEDRALSQPLLCALQLPGQPLFSQHVSSTQKYLLY